MKAAISLFFTVLLSVSLLGATQPKIEIALILDTSGSMDGLINQAKTQLWRLVNDMAVAKRHGQVPTLRVALLEYGKSSLPASEGYLRTIAPLTSDLDRISEVLFELKTNGGDEYAGWAIESALNLDWSASAHDFKAVFIAGNESFAQGPRPYQDAVRAAITRGITVNTIYCGNAGHRDASSWRDGAALADGRFSVLDQNQAMVARKTPFDKDILELNQRLNKTFVAYGAKGKVGRLRQERMDQAAEQAMPSAAVERAVTKASKVYESKTWDLVSAVEADEVELDDVAEAVLPEPLQGLSKEEKEKKLGDLRKEREQVSKDIQVLRKKRDQYLAKQATEKQDLGDRMIAIVREQLKAKNFEIKKP